MAIVELRDRSTSKSVPAKTTNDDAHDTARSRPVCYVNYARDKHGTKTHMYSTPALPVA